jgi:hypothetical protein
MMSDIQSDSLDKFIPAFIKAQAAMKNAELDKGNPAFKSRYASLVSVREAVMQPLLDEKFMVTHQMERVSAGTLVITKIIHESGQWMGSIWPIPEDVMSNAQKAGSALTYGRRYSLASLCGITAAEEDDDGHDASKHKQGTTAPPSPPSDGSKEIYDALKASLRATKTTDELKAWKETVSPEAAISSMRLITPCLSI